MVDGKMESFGKMSEASVIKERTDEIIEKFGTTIVTKLVELVVELQVEQETLKEEVKNLKTSSVSNIFYF